MEKIISMLSGIVSIFTAFKKNQTNFLELTVAGGTPLQPESEKINLNKNEIVSLEDVSGGEVGKTVINLRSGESINVEETKLEISKKLK